MEGTKMNEIGKNASTSDTEPGQVKAAADRVANKASDSIASAKSAVNETVNTIADKATAATNWASQKIGAASEAPSEFVDSGAEYIRSRPYTAVGIAIVVGYVFGRLRS